jgi:hypothetical protein
MKHHQRGLTIHQLLTSLAIIGTVAAVGLPQATQMLSNSRLNRAARTLVISIHRSKLQAIQRCNTYYLDFDLDGDGNLESGGCIMWEDRNDNCRKELLERSETVWSPELFPGVHLRAYPTSLGGPKRGPNNTRIDAGGGDGVSFSHNRIKFNPNSTCSTGTVYLHNRTGRTFAIRIRYNGLTQLWHHDGSSWER